MTSLVIGAIFVAVGLVYMQTGPIATNRAILMYATPISFLVFGIILIVSAVGMLILFQR